MEERTRLYFARHGETTTSAEFRYIGQSDVDITPLGVEQMEKLRERFRHEAIDAFFCSDLTRSRKGAEIIAGCHSRPPVSCREFREINLGIWEGLTREEILERHPQEYAARSRDLACSRIEGGESFSDLQVRVMEKLGDILARFAGRTLLLLAHGGVNRVILCDALTLDLALLPRIDQAYGCLNIIDYYESGPVVKLVNG